jgi:hypothetical protein
VVGRDIGNVPEEALEAAVDGAEDEEVVVEGAQEHRLKGHLQLWLAMPADVVDEAVAEEGPEKEQQLHDDELGDESSREDDHTEGQIHHLHEDDLVLAQAIETKSDVREQPSPRVVGEESLQRLP